MVNVPLLGKPHKLTVLMPPCKLVQLATQPFHVLSSGMVSITGSLAGVMVMNTIAVSHRLGSGVPSSHTL